jgi:hypothetical protein
MAKARGMIVYRGSSTNLLDTDRFYANSDPTMGYRIVNPGYTRNGETIEVEAEQDGEHGNRPSGETLTFLFISTHSVVNIVGGADLIPIPIELNGPRKTIWEHLVGEG